MNALKGMRAVGWWRAGFAVWFALASALLAGAGPAGAEGMQTYDGLNSAARNIAKKLNELAKAEDGPLAGRQVVMSSVHDFYEEQSERILPLSKRLLNLFRTELSRSESEMKVVAYPKDGKDEVLVLQGEWSEQPGGRSETRTIRLTVRVREENGDYIWSERGAEVKNIDAKLLEETLESRGSYAVKQLDKGVSKRRVVHVGSFKVDGEEMEESGALRSYLYAQWLVPAFGKSRRFGLAMEPRGGSDEEVLNVDVHVGTEQLSIVLAVYDKDGHQVTSAQVKMDKGLVPQKVFEVEPDRRHLAIESGIIGMSRDRLPELQRESDCEHSRGLVNARHDFERPFAEPPKVVLSIHHLDIDASKTVRIRAHVVDTDERGFSYDLITWCDTIVHGVDMSWIAYGYR